MITHTDYTQYVTRPGKTGLIYTKYTCSYYGIYLPFCMGAIHNLLVLLNSCMDFCTYDDISHTIRFTDKKLLHFKLKIRSNFMCR